MGCCISTPKGKASLNATITVKGSSLSDKVEIGYCKCAEDVRDPNTDDCEAEGCGKPLHFCGECFKLIKMEGDNCSCGWAKKKLGKAERRQF